MTAVTLPVSGSIRAQRVARAARSRAEGRARLRTRVEPLLVFALTTAVLVALGVRTTVSLHLVYPDALTRLVHTYIAWWNHPPRFRSIGFAYPPLQSVALLPFALLRPLATSLVALPVFSALCGGVTVATLDRTLVLLDLNWWMRLPLLAAFLLNPLFLDYGANGMADCLVMALLAAGLHNFCAWYVHGADSVRSLGFCGFWLAIAFLARYETVLWLGLFALTVAVVRFRRGASAVEVLAQEVILLAPLVYVFLIWSGVSSLVGGGGFLSWVTLSGAQHVSALGYGGRHDFATRALGVVNIVWRISPLMFIVPALLTLEALVLRRAILIVLAAAVLLGAGLSVARMLVLPNPELLTPGYQMVALVPMLVATGWLLSLAPRDRSSLIQAIRATATAAALAGLLVSLATAYELMRRGANPYDRAFTVALSSHLQRIGPPAGSGPADDSANQYADTRALATFFDAAVYSRKTVLLDERAFPGLILADDTTVPYRTRAEDGNAFWERLLAHPRTRHLIDYLVVANPHLTAPGYPRDRVSARYPTAYAGGLAHTQVIFRTPLVAVVQLLPLGQASAGLLPSGHARLLQLYQNLPALSPHRPGGGAHARPHRARAAAGAAGEARAGPAVPATAGERGSRRRTRSAFPRSS